MQGFVLTMAVMYVMLNLMIDVMANCGIWIAGIVRSSPPFKHAGEINANDQMRRNGKRFVLSGVTSVTLRSISGERTLQDEDFIAGYRSTALQRGEFMDDSHPEAVPPARHLFVYKLSKRFTQDISTIIAACDCTAGRHLARLARVLWRHGRPVKPGSHT